MTRVDLRSLVHDQREPEGQETVRRKGDDLCDQAVLDAKNIQRQGAPSGIAGPVHIGSDRWLKVGAGHNAAETAGISRKTGYKIYDRYKGSGVQAFTDRSRRPYRQANRLPAPIEATIVRLKREYPGWGAPKIREKLRPQITTAQLPAISTVHAVLDRHGLVNRRRRRRPAGAAGTGLSQPTEPNALWCADYNGEFMLGNRRYCQGES